jgi:hypothetical protein
MSVVSAGKNRKFGYDIVTVIKIVVLARRLCWIRLYMQQAASAADLEGPAARRLALLLLLVWPGSAED